MFTPKLVKAYTQLKRSAKVGAQFELLFVSADRSQEEFDEYYEEMNFGAIPYDSASKKALTKALAIRGYPTLLILSPGPDRTLIHPNIRGIIETGDYLSDFPYLPRPYGDLNHTPHDINDHRCVIVFCEGGDDEAQEDVMDAIKLASVKRPDMNMYWACTFSQVTRSVRAAVQLGPITDDAIMILLDIPDHGGYYVYRGDVTEQSIVKFIERPGERLQIGG